MEFFAFNFLLLTCALARYSDESLIFVFLQKFVRDQFTCLWHGLWLIRQDWILSYK